MKKITAQYVIANASRGFTLLEALIAMLVLSIGLLGLAGLQASSARLSSEAYLRSITTMASSEIIEKIRMRTGKLSRPARLPIINQYSKAAAGACDPAASSIDNDFSCWQKDIVSQMPQGKGVIIDKANGSFEIQISWFDRQNQQSSTISMTYFAGAL
jgi:type IV pilus assembly protein PilV